MINDKEKLLNKDSKRQQYLSARYSFKVCVTECGPSNIVLQSQPSVIEWDWQSLQGFVVFGKTHMLCILEYVTSPPETLAYVGSGWGTPNCVMSAYSVPSYAGGRTTAAALAPDGPGACPASCLLNSSNSA